MRILVLGAGGVGGYFGGRLAAAGVDVSFLVRAARASALTRRGLAISSPLGDLRLDVATLTAVTSTFDAVLLACKAFDLDNAIEAIAPAIGPSTLIAPLLNGVGHLDTLDARFGLDHVAGGLCHIGVTMTENGEIRHLNKLQRFVLGARNTNQAEPVEAIHGVLIRGGFDPVRSEAIMQEMWEKFVFLTAYAAMTTLMRAPVGAILTSHDGEALVREMLDECRATAIAAGYPPRPDIFMQMQATLTERGSTGTASMLRDMERGSRTEHDHILGDMLARARNAGVSTPLLRVSFAHMQSYDSLRSGAVAK